MTIGTTKTKLRITTAGVASLAMASLLLLAAGCGAATPTPVPTQTSEQATAVPTDTTAPAADTPAASMTPAPLVTPTSEPVGTPVSSDSGWRQVGAADKRVQDLAAKGGSPVLAVGPDGTWLASSGPVGSASGEGVQFDDYTNWQPLTAHVGGNLTTAAVGSPDVMYVTGHTGCLSGLPITLLRTIDGGRTWQPVEGPAQPLEVAAVDATLAYGTTCTGVARSGDAGATWAVLPGAGLENFDPREVVSSADGKTLFVAYVSEGGSGRIQRSTDSGATWVEITPNTAPGTQITGPSNLTLVPGEGSQIGVLMTSYDGLWFLPPASNDWQLVSATNPSAENPEQFTAVAGDTISAGRVSAIYAAKATVTQGVRKGEGVFRSTDGGTSWEPFGSGLGETVINKLLLVPYNHTSPPPGSVLLAATDNGIWLSGLSRP
jgi:photosystem II stability/assembly factor-like uncharacterized protein